MLKKLFCNHKYEYYHRSKYIPSFGISDWDKWHFICKKCGKTSYLFDDVLYDEWKRISEKVDREKAMSIDNIKYDNFTFILGCHIYKGKGAYYMQQKYKKYYQENVIPTW